MTQNGLDMFNLKSMLFTYTPKDKISSVSPCDEPFSRNLRIFNFPMCKLALTSKFQNSNKNIYSEHHQGCVLIVWLQILRTVKEIGFDIFTPNLQHRGWMDRRSPEQSHTIGSARRKLAELKNR